MAAVRPVRLYRLHHPAGWWRAGWWALAASLLLASCANPPSAPASALAAPAKLSVINLTDYVWHLVISRAGGGTVRDFQVKARASEVLELAGGDYLIEQTVLEEGVAGADLTRKIPSTFIPGQSYRWRLATLLSEPADGRDTARP